MLRIRRHLERVAAVGAKAASRAAIVPARGVHRIAGLAGEVTVCFDAWGVPHIRAATDADAFLAQGFCHGLDRFFQMDMLRRVLAGRLAETVGERALGARSATPLAATSTTLDADRLMRHLDLVRSARRGIARASAEDRALLDAYVTGVNAAVARLRRRRGVEYRILRLALEPWTGLDSILLSKGMALGLSFKWRTAPVLTALAGHLQDRPRLLEAILPPCPRPGDLALAQRIAHGVDQALTFVPTPIPPAGSNAFVVGGARSRSGRPLLASDPHLELTLPSIWYLVSLSGSRFRSVGCSLPGLPGVVIGRTATLAWGLTNGMIDDGDFWAEEVDGTGTRYRVDGRWRPLAIETQEIRRRGRSPVLMRLRRTHRGPLFTDAFPGYEGTPLSLRLTLHEAADDLQVFLALGRAHRAADARAAADGYGAPAQNLLYADAEGGAGYLLMGRVPRRASHPVHPGLVRDGTDSGTDWMGTLDPSELPAFDIGPDGVVVSANEALLAAAEAPYLSHLYEPPHRAHRIRECLAGRTDLTIDDLAAIQGDTHNAASVWFRRLVLLPHAEAVRRMRPSLGRLLDRLLAWDGNEGADEVGPALWHLTYHHLLRRTFGPALGEELLDRWLGLVNLMDAPLQRAFEDPDSPWAPPASRVALLQWALEDAEKDLAARGLDAGAPWGRIHTLTLDHPLSSVPLLGPAFTRGPWPLGGGPYAPASGQYPQAHPARVVAGASYRQVVDLADVERSSRMITYGGQSGHIGSPHYDDLTALWRAGGGIPMRLEMEPEGGDHLLLLPTATRRPVAR